MAKGFNILLFLFALVLGLVVFLSPADTLATHINICAGVVYENANCSGDFSPFLVPFCSDLSSGCQADGRTYLTCHETNICSHCTPSTFCRNGDVWQRDNLCSETLVEECTYGCAEGSCLPQPVCTSDAWSCGDWDPASPPCHDPSIQTRTCTLVDTTCSDPDAVKPSESQTCPVAPSPPPPPPVPPPPPPPPPSATINSPAAESWQNANFSVTYDTSNAIACEIEIKNGASGTWSNKGTISCGSGQSKSVQVPAWCSAEGVNECRVRVRADAAQDERFFSIDLTAPKVTDFKVNRTAKPPGVVLASSTPITITWTATDTGGSGIDHTEVWRAPDVGGAPGSWDSINLNAISGFVNDPGDGTWWYGIHVVDKAGNCITEAGGHCGGVTSDTLDPRTNRGPIKVILDTSSPDTIIDSTPPALSNSNSAPFTYHSTEAGSTFACSLDGAAFTSCASAGKTYSGLAQGSHTFQVGATDIAGNTDATPASFTWLIDLTAPTVTDFKVNEIAKPGVVLASSAPITITWTATDTGGSTTDHIELWRARDAEGWGQVGANMAPATTSTSDTPPADGAWWYGIHVVDKAGNCITEAGGHCGGVTSDTLDPRTNRGPIKVILDRTPPVVSFDFPAAGSWQNANFTVQYDATDTPIQIQTCTLSTKDGGEDWVQRQNGISVCGSDQQKTIDIAWCFTQGVDACGVRISASDPVNTTTAERFFSIDLTAPTITSFTASDGATTVDHTTDPLITTSGSITLAWTASDNTGGSGIQHYEVWQSPDGAVGWTQVGLIGATNFTHSPELGQDWWYGIHAIDNANSLGTDNNCITEAGVHCGGVTSDTQDPRTLFGPIRVVMNKPPIVNAGLDQTLDFGLPSVSATLSGTVTDDGFPAPYTVAWSLVAGDASKVNITSPTSAATNVIFTASGDYAFKLEADDTSAIGSDTIAIKILNNTPIVSISPPALSVDFGFLPVTLQGAVSDDGLPNPNPPNPTGNLSLTWKKISGPGNVSFSNPSGANTDINLSQAGDYVLQLEAFDGEKTGAGKVAIEYGAPSRYGLLPCGVIIDDPATPWDETENCELKHFFLLLKNVIDFTLWKLVPLIIVLLVVATGAIFFFQFGGPAAMAKVRAIWSAVGKGALILLFSWLFLNFLLGVLGFDVNIFGRWYEISS